MYLATTTTGETFREFLSLRLRAERSQIIKFTIAAALSDRSVRGFNEWRGPEIYTSGYSVYANEQWEKN